MLKRDNYDELLCSVSQLRDEKAKLVEIASRAFESTHNPILAGIDQRPCPAGLGEALLRGSLIMALRANVGGGQRDEFGLSFEDILAQDDKKGMYVNRRGDILIVFSNSPQLVNCGRQTRTGYTRTGMGLIPGEGRRGAGGLRVVVSTRDRDTERKWKKFDQQITLEGNPHLVGAPEPAAQGDGYDGDDEADCG